MMRNKIFFLCLYFLSWGTQYVVAAGNETLPSYHWAYEYIDELHARGMCLDLLQTAKPYSRGEVAQSLLKLEQEKDYGNLSLFVKAVVSKLKNEFQTEMLAFQTASHVDSREEIQLRSNFRGNLDLVKNDDAKYRGTYRAGMGLKFLDHFYAFSGVNFDQYNYYDPNYTGYKWRGLVGYTEQAYVLGQWKRLQVKLGRDFLQWGLGRNGTLVFSNVARPLDQLFASLNFGPFKFSFISAELDEFSPLKIDDVRIPVKRYLTGHRLDVRLWSGRLQFGVSEILVYGGPNESIKLVYLNPAIFYKGTHKNKASYAGNILPSLDLLIYPMKNLQFYTSLLIDDIQLEKTGPGDLEPNEIGWIIGTTWADPFQLMGTTLNSEFVMVTNRTYKTPFWYETFVHRNVPLGHPLGCDFYSWNLQLSHGFKQHIWGKMDYRLIKKGEGSIYTPWDEPWMNYTVEEGYEEPFPTGVIETTNQIAFEVKWHYNAYFRIFTKFGYNDVRNIENEKGNNGSYWDAKIQLEFDFARKWELNTY